MAKISTFELLSKRVGPPGGITGDYNNPINAPFRKLLQGYYLTVANFNDREARLQMQAIFPRIDTCGYNSPFNIEDREMVRTPDANHRYAYDITGHDGFYNPRIFEGPMSQVFGGQTPTSNTYSTRTSLLCNFQTGLFNLLPDPASVAAFTPQIEIRGYIKMVQVRRCFFRGGRVVYGRPPKPIDLMFTPELRGTYIDNRFPDFSFDPADLDFDQNTHALPTATGAAVITVEEWVNPRIFIYTGDLGLVQEVPAIPLEGLPARIDLSGRVLLSDEGIKSVEDQRRKAKDNFGGETKSLKQLVTEIESELTLLYDPEEVELK